MTEPATPPWQAHARFAPVLAIAALAVMIAWGFAFVTLHHTTSMGLPLDDSYIYLTYAKQIGRGQPFTYFPGGGYSAGSTSVLWPMLLAPFWTLGAHGHALVWVAFVMCSALYAAVAIGCWRLVHAITGGGASGQVAGVIAAVLTLSIAPFAWTALSGMEVAFAAALLVATLLLLVAAPRTGPPRKLLAITLAATSLSRPEATLLVVAIIGVAVITRARAREWRAAAWWLAPLAAPALWLTTNRILAGHFMPNTGVVKSHFYLPGFDWTYWRAAVVTLSGQLAKDLFWDPGSPLGWPRVVGVAWVIGAVRVALWARRARQPLVGALVIAAPPVLMLAVIATSGQWNFQNYRYIAPAFPLLMVTVALALAPPRWVREPMARLVWCVIASTIALAFAVGGWPRMRTDMLLYAQGVTDANTQVVEIGRYVQRKLPRATVMLHDAGAIAYYGDGPVFDMLGLVTNHQADVGNNGPGARFEFLESLPPEQRPAYFAYYPGWMGSPEFFGEMLLRTPLVIRFAATRFARDADMRVFVANWDHVHTGERPIAPHDGWAMVDRVDVADLASERAHAWRGELGRREVNDPTARWSLVERETLAQGLVIDGGRTIRGGREQFTIALDPTKPTRLVLRSGGQNEYKPYHESIDKPVELALRADDGRELARATVPAPTGTFAEIAFELPTGTFATARATIHVEAPAPYRDFHWFVLQPE